MVVFRLWLRIEIFSVCLCLVRLPSRSKAKRTLSQRICVCTRMVLLRSAVPQTPKRIAIVQTASQTPDHSLSGAGFPEQLSISFFFYVVQQTVQHGAVALLQQTDALIDPVRQLGIIADFQRHQ